MRIAATLLIFIAPAALGGCAPQQGQIATYQPSTGSNEVLRGPIESAPGQEAVTLGPGNSLRIPAGTVHSGLSGPDGVRAVASWVVVDGQPLRVAVPQ